MRRYLRHIIGIVCVAISVAGWAQTEQIRRCEIGLSAGMGYYVGDASKHVFTNIAEAYGLQFRYKFDPRWALQVKGTVQRIRGTWEPELGKEQAWGTRMANVDVMGEYNFFRFGEKQYDERIKPITPYVGIGIGASMCMGLDWALRTEPSPAVQVYLPVALGVKWKVAPICQLQLAWQHNVYFADNLEGEMELCDTHKLNGSNIINNDISSQIVFGIVFEFMQDEKVCPICF